MKIKPFSWFLAGAFLLFGVVFFVTLPKFETIFSGLDVLLPSPTRCVLTVGRFGWLSVAVIAGALLILKDLKFRSRLWDWIFLMLFALWAGSITVALLLPLIRTSTTSISAG
jgi:type II secretory pathway component PulF